MKSPVVKRSIVIAGHKTSVSLEDAFWKGLKEIAGTRDLTLSDLVSTIDSERRHGNLSSAIRLFVLNHYAPRSAANPTFANRRRRARSLRSASTDGRLAATRRPPNAAGVTLN
jgi:predicted DNA-binding ribbon-helix-helix protein